MVQEGSRLVRSSCYVLRVMLSGKAKNHVRRTVWNVYELKSLTLKISNSSYHLYVDCIKN